MIGKNIFLNFPANKYLEKLPNFKEEKTQRFTTLVLTFLALSFFGFFAINPTLSTITQLKKQLADNLFIEKKLEEKITNLAILQQKYNLLKTTIPVVIQALPQTPTIPLLIGQVQALALKSNLSIERLQVFQVELSNLNEDKNKESSFAFSFQGQGSYVDISNFLSSLINFDRLVTLDTIALTSMPEKDKLVKLDLRGRAYFKK